MSLVDDYLNHTTDTPGRHSTLSLALWDCRRTTGRDEGTGQFTDPDAPHALTWIAALGYLCMLDQLGSVIELVAPTAAMEAELASWRGRVETNFRRPLVHFSVVSSDDASALYALRNCLAHDYSLANPSQRAELRRAFRLHADVGALVEHPATGWDGSFAAVDSDPHKTSVSLRVLGDLVESIVAGVGVAHGAGLVRTTLSDDELLARYFVVIRYGQS